MENSSRGSMKKLRDIPRPPPFVPPKLLICFDPGAICGFSVWVGGKLTACGYGKHAKFMEEPVHPGRLVGGVFLVERPVSYPGKRMKVDPNSLMQTDFRAGELSVLYRLLGMQCEEVRPPSAWKGQVPHEEIEERVLDRVTDEERLLIHASKSARSKGLDHNLIDAVGIGLWRLRRWRKK